MTAYAYLLRCADGSLYAGWTVCPERRLESHNQGRGAKYTRGRLPVRMARVWMFEDRGAAMRFEHWLKQLNKAEKERLIQACSVQP